MLEVLHHVFFLRLWFLLRTLLRKFITVVGAVDYFSQHEVLWLIWKCPMWRKRTQMSKVSFVVVLGADRGKTAIQVHSFVFQTTGTTSFAGVLVLVWAACGHNASFACLGSSFLWKFSLDVAKVASFHSKCLLWWTYFGAGCGTWWNTNCHGPWYHFWRWRTYWRCCCRTQRCPDDVVDRVI